MSREEAATIYLDSLLGFKRDYEKFVLSREVLTREEMALLEDAVSAWRREDSMTAGYSGL